MNYEDIKKLIEDMGNSKLTEINIDFPDGTKIKMKKDKELQIVEKTADKIIQSQPIEQSQTIQENPKTEEGNIVKSPMVGTFYYIPFFRSEGAHV